MEDERRRRLEDVVDAVLDQPAGARLAALEAACRDDLELLAAAHDLIAAHDLAGDFLEDPLRTIGSASLQRMLGAAVEDDAPPPERLGPYRVLGLLGAGGMGTVYLATDEHGERRVAIKVVNDRSRHHQLGRRLSREARLLARLDHPNLVRVHDVLDLAGSPALVMELVLGHDLAALVVPGGLAVQRAVALARQLAAGLAAAHAAGVVHRDLRAENVKVSADGQVKILDFGIAQAERQGSETEEPSSGSHAKVLGAAATIAPEQVLGRQAGTAADVFALGALLYQLLTGHHPFAAAAIVDTMRRVLEHSPPPLGELNPAVPRALAELVAVMLSKEPERRPTAAAVARELERTALDLRPLARE